MKLGTAGEKRVVHVLGSQIDDVILVPICGVTALLEWEWDVSDYAPRDSLPDLCKRCGRIAFSMFESADVQVGETL